MNVLKLLTLVVYGKLGCYFGHCLRLFMSIFGNWVCLCCHKYSLYTAGLHRKSWAVVELVQGWPKFMSDLPVFCIHLFTRDLLFFLWNKNQLMSLFQFYLYIAGSLHVSGPQAHPQESSHSCSHNHWFLVIQ